MLTQTRIDSPSSAFTTSVRMFFNTLRPKQNGRHFPDDILKRVFLKESVRIVIKISLKIVGEGQINSIPSLV